MYGPESVLWEYTHTHTLNTQLKFESQPTFQTLNTVIPVSRFIQSGVRSCGLGTGSLSLKVQMELRGSKIHVAWDKDRDSSWVFAFVFTTQSILATLTLLFIHVMFHRQTTDALRAGTGVLHSRLCRRQQAIMGTVCRFSQ